MTPSKSPSTSPRRWARRRKACTFVEVLRFPGRSLDNWGLRGGQPACELDLGFRLDV